MALLVLTAIVYGTVFKIKGYTSKCTNCRQPRVNWELSKKGPLKGGPNEYKCPTCGAVTIQKLP